ncbi:MAG TPA: acyltransferase, partial [Methanosarcina sp.]|nr:acyltransferase [Methanosarcina sp.]
FSVFLFFALSGCTLFISSADKINSLKDWGIFYIRRFLRIWPVFAVSMLFYIGFIEVFKSHYFAARDLWIAQFLADYSFANVLQYLSLTYNITGPSYLFCGPYWSLPVEFQFYLMLPAALILMRRSSFGLVVPILFAFTLYVLYSTSLVHLEKYEVLKMGYTFFGGVLLAKLHRRVGLRLSFSVSVTAFFTLVLLVVLVSNNLVSLPSVLFRVFDLDHLCGILAVLSVALALFSKPIKYRSRLMDYLDEYGEISYSIYLFHMLFVGAAALIVVNLEIYTANSKLIFIMLISLGGSYWFSKYTYRYIEKTTIEWGRRLG